MTESVEAPERIWIESEGECPYFYHEEELSDVGSPVTEYVRADKLRAEVDEQIDREAGEGRTGTGEQSMKLVVIVSNFGAAANVGGCVEIEAKIFDLPEEIADYIRKSRTEWTSISLAFSDEAEENKA